MKNSSNCYSKITTMRRQSLSANSTTNFRKMEISSSVESLSHKTIKQKFMRWASKWYYADIVDDNPDKPDATLLISLLQSIGFQLRQFEKSNGINEPYENDNSIKVTIECGSSKMKAVLEMNDVTCQCPNPQDANDAEFWSVSGTAPTGSMDCINKFEETGSNLVPKLSKDSHRVIHDVIHGLLNIIKNKVAANLNMDDSASISTFEKIAKGYYETYKTFDSSEAFSRCYTQPEMPSFAHRHNEANNNLDNSHGSDIRSRHLSTIDVRSSSSYQNLPKITTTPAQSDDQPTPTLLRQQTWDMETRSVESEPRSSPPKISSSPAICTDLCTSLGRVSLQSNESSLTLVECLKRARFYIERAQNLQASKRSPGGSEAGSVSMNTSKGSDSFVKPTTRLRARTTAQLRSTTSSTSKLKASSGLSQDYGQKLLSRRSISGIGSGLTGRKSTDISKASTSERATPTLPTSPLVRRQTVGVPTSGLKLAVSGAQRKIAAAKVGSSLSISSGSSRSSTSAGNIHDQTRVFVPAKRRVSPDIKDSPLHTMSSGSIGQNKLSSTTRTPTNIGSTSSTITPKSTGSSQSRLSGINSGLKRPTSNLPKFTLTKK